MSARQLRFLALAAAVLVIAAVAASLLERAPAPDARQRLYPALEERLNDASRVTLQLGPERVLTLEREDAQWQVREKDGYPANVSQLRKVLLALARTELVEEKTSSAAYYERLGVQEPAQAGEDTRLVRVEAGDEILAEVIVGKSGDGGASYLRRAGEAPSWQGSEWIDLPARTGAWLDTELLDIAPERISTVEVVRADAEPLRLERENDTLRLSNGGQPVAARAQELERVVGALRELSIEDVLEETEAEVDADEQDWNWARFVTGDGLTLAVQTRDDGERLLLRATAELQGENPDEALQQEAETLNRRLGGRRFVVPSYLQGRLAPTLEDLREATE